MFSKVICCRCQKASVCGKGLKNKQLWTYHIYTNVRRFGRESSSSKCFQSLTKYPINDRDMIPSDQKKLAATDDWVRISDGNNSVIIT